MVDEITFYVRAGDGGDGIIHWHREKYLSKGGPDGGNGGTGGDVYIKAIRNLSALNKFKKNKEYSAEDGGDGKKQLMNGKNGDDIVLEVPVGSVVENIDTGEVFDLDKDEQIVQVAAGGTGGFGNDHFKSSRNTTPIRATKGIPGQHYRLIVKLKLIADVGLIGFPSSGKSTLINMLTDAKAKVGEYPFTTLTPNLGVRHNVIYADIPGLIDGASLGKGLGHRFLKHISRTKILLHLVSVEEKDVDKAYRTIRLELGRYNATLLDKKEIILLTKIDIIDKEDIEKKRKALSQHGKVVAISALIDECIKEVGDEVTKILDQEKLK